MSSAMEDINYLTCNFNLDVREQSVPKVLHEKHYLYHVETDEFGYLICQRDNKGRPITSPRCLRDMCIYRLVQEVNPLKSLKHPAVIPSNVFPLLLTEAIYLRDSQTIEWAVSNWPMKTLTIRDHLPPEDYVEDDYLTLPMEDNEKMCLVDCFVIGLLKLKPEANLNYIDFTGFAKDRKLCKELSRLPILWMKPSERTAENIHEYMSDTLDITKDKAQRYLNRIDVVYSNYDNEFIHGNKIGIITIALDLYVSIDDVPLGLSLQSPAPFKFVCNYLWMKPIPEVGFSPCNISRVLDTTKITHFEYEDPLLSNDEPKFDQLIDGIDELRFLITLSLPNCIDTTIGQNMVDKLNTSINKLRYLQRLNFSYCNLKNQLHVLLGNFRPHLTYLNLKDCRLCEEDVAFLVHSRCIIHLRELTLSCNDLRFQEHYIMSMLGRMPHITCLGLSHCQLNTHQQVLIVRRCKDCSQLKVIKMHGYTPLPQNDTLEILNLIAQVKTVQKVVLFPEAFGFPGGNEKERELNRIGSLRLGYRYLSMRDREDIFLE